MDCGMLDYWWCPGCKFVGEGYPRSEPPRIIAPQFANNFFFSQHIICCIFLFPLRMTVLSCYCPLKTETIFYYMCNVYLRFVVILRYHL